MTNILDKLIEEKIDTAARIYVINKRRDDLAYFQFRSIEDFTEGAKWAIKIAKECGLIIEENPIELNYNILKEKGWKKDIDGWYKLQTGRANLYIKRSSVNDDEFLLCVSEDKHDIARVTYLHELKYLIDSFNCDKI